MMFPDKVHRKNGSKCAFVFVMLPLTLPFQLSIAADAADENFYKGKTLTVKVASKPGGGTDTTARLIAKHWGKQIPGNPAVIVRNSTLQVIAANELHHKVRPDGLTVGVFAGGGSLGPVNRKSRSVKYDPIEWGFVGSIERGPTVLLIRKSARERLYDKSKKPIAHGSVSTDRPQDALAIFGAEYLGWNIKFVLGYPNSRNIYLAYTRGEVDMFGSGTDDILERFIKNEGATPLTSETRRVDMPDVKTFVELLGDKKPKGDKWAAYGAWTGPSSVDKYFAVPPKTPESRIAILQKTFMATTKDGAFAKDAENVLGKGYVALTGEATRNLVAGAIGLTPGALAEIKRLRSKYGLPAFERKVEKLYKVTFSDVKRDGRVLHFTHEGKALKVRVGGSSTEVTIAGTPAERSKLAKGMTCEVSWEKRATRVLARTVICP